MELPVKQKQTKNWCRLSSLTPVTNNKRLYEQADPWIRLNTWVLTNSASESHCMDLGFFLFFHLWKLIQSHTGYFPQNSAVRHKRHLVLSQNCNWLISPVVKAWVQLKLKSCSEQSDPSPMENSRTVTRAQCWVSANLGDLGPPPSPVSLNKTINISGICILNCVIN